MSDVSPSPSPSAGHWPVVVAALIVALSVWIAVATLWFRPEPERKRAAAPEGGQATFPPHDKLDGRARRTAATAVPAMTPARSPSPRMSATAPPTPALTATPVLTAAPTETPTPPPPVRATPAPTLAPDAVLVNIAPPQIRRGTTALLDVRGSALRSEHQVQVWRGGRAPSDVHVVRYKVIDPSLLRVQISADSHAPTGSYYLTVTDPEGGRSNAVSFRVTE